MRIRDLVEECLSGLRRGGSIDWGGEEEGLEMSRWKVGPGKKRKRKSRGNRNRIIAQRGYVLCSLA